MTIAATTVFEVRTTGSDSNGGGFDSALGGTDYSQQNAAQATGTVTSASTTVTATTGIFTAQMVGNLMTDGTTWVEIVAFTSSLIVTVDAAPSWTAATIKVGGALATIQAALSLNTVQGVNIYVRGGTYSISTGLTWPSGPDYTSINRVIGYGTIRGDLGRPIITATASMDMLTMNRSGCSLENFEVNGNAQTSTTCLALMATYGIYIVNCIVHGSTLFNINCGNGIINIIGTESYGASLNGINAGTITTIFGCNIHSNGSHGIVSNTSTVISRCTIANNTSHGINGSSAYQYTVTNNTIYNNGGDGILLLGGVISLQSSIINNLIVANGGYGINQASASIGSLNPAFNYNAVKSNTSGNYHNLSAGANDVLLMVDPFTNAAGSDFSLNNTAGGGAACRATGYPGVFPGGLTTGYLDIGAVQHQDSGGGGGASGGGDLGLIVQARQMMPM